MILKVTAKIRSREGAWSLEHTTLEVESHDRDGLRAALYSKYTEAAMVVILSQEEIQDANYSKDFS